MDETQDFDELDLVFVGEDLDSMIAFGIGDIVSLMVFDTRFTGIIRRLTSEGVAEVRIPALLGTVVLKPCSEMVHATF